MKLHVLLPSIVLGLLGGAADPAAKILPVAPPGAAVTLIAREPRLRNPCALDCDTRSRLFVGQGPQDRNPKPDTPGNGDDEAANRPTATRTWALWTLGRLALEDRSLDPWFASDTHRQSISE